MTNPTGQVEDRALGGASVVHPEETSPRGVAIYNVNPGSVTHEYAMSVAGMLVHYLAHDIVCPIRGYFQRPGTSVVSIARNEACRHFLNNMNAEYMLQIDSDIEFPNDALDRGLELLHTLTEPSVVSGLYLTTLPEGLVACAWPNAFGAPFNQTELLTAIANDVKLLPCARTGAGFLWVHRSVLERMYHADPDEPWFGDSTLEGHRRGEDFTFCDRARRLGIPIYLDLTADLTHMKTIGWNRAMLGNVQVTDVREEG